MRKILVVTCSYDRTVDYILAKYKSDFEFFRFNVDRFAEYKIVISESYWEISQGSYTINQEEVLSIYYRKPAFPDTHDFDMEFRRLIHSDILSVVEGIVNSFNGIVLTKPCILRKTENKIFQLLYAQNNKILMSNSFIGNNIGFNQIDNPRIIMPISIGKILKDGEVSIIQTNIMHENDQYDDLGLTPIYVQKYVKKKYEVRLTVAGDDFYAVKIVSDNSVDWRDGDKNTYELIETPPEIKKTIRKLLFDFNLQFGAIDYIVDPDDNWFFLEINPNGQWQWLESALNLTISESIRKEHISMIYDKYYARLSGFETSAGILEKRLSAVSY